MAKAKAKAKAKGKTKVKTKVKAKTKAKTATLAKKKKGVAKNKAKKKVIKKAATKKKTVKKLHFIPKDYHAITPYLIIDQAANAIEFYKKIFGAKEVMRMEKPNGKIGHAELKIGDAKIMLADESPEMNAKSPQNIGGTPVGIHLYTKNVDDVVKHAVIQGAKLTRPVETMFYGDRSGAIEDPYGHIWYVSTHVEDVTPAKIKKRAAEMYGNTF